MLHMVGASSAWVLHEDGLPLGPAEVEEISRQAMDALLDVESETGGQIHSASVSAILAEARISIEFCVNAATIDEAQVIVAQTLRSVLQDRLGHRLLGADQETSRDLALVAG